MLDWAYSVLTMGVGEIPVWVAVLSQLVVLILVGIRADREN